MTPAEREAFYDAEVAPVLLDLSKRCQERGMSFVACVDWSPKDVGVTASLRRLRSPQVQWATWAALSKGNVDNLLLEIWRRAKKEGHSSIVLNLAGVPLSPAGHEAEDDA